MDYVKELARVVDQMREDGLVEICFTPGSDAEVDPQDVARVALAMLGFQAMKPRMYPNKPLKEPVGPFKNIAFQMVRENFKPLA